MTNKKPLNLKSAENSTTTFSVNTSNPWRVLIVDDDADVHAVSRLILNKIVFKHRPLELLCAYSAVQARDILISEKNIAVILLDVVMETEDAGLKLVRVIREELKNSDVRIILRTGQPGQAPEERVIVDYDINDYKAKNELTSQKLFTAVISALRAYETIMSLNKTRHGLEKILHSSDSLFKIQSMNEFASGILTQLSLFLDCKPQGIICIEENNDVEINPSRRTLPNNMKIIAATEEFECCLQCNLDESCGHDEIAKLVHRTIRERKTQFNANYSAFYLDTNEKRATIALVCSEENLDTHDRNLLEVFTSKISIALANAIHYQKMISFEKAATTDFLTGLNNRRQLLRLGAPLLALANRNNCLAVAMIDIDYFKRINDSYGHDVGDIVLKKLAEMMNERFRRMDVIARYGGEEFCVLAPSLNISQAFELFDNFRASVANMQIAISENETIHITLSIGVTTDLCPDLDDMIAAADYLLYRAKSNGRNCVMVR